MRKILYIGDDQQFIGVLKNENLGEYSVHIEPNGFLASEHINLGKHKPDIIFAEYKSSSISALQLFKAMRDEGNIEKVVFIVLVKSNNFQLNSSAFKLGIDDVLTKPLAPEKLKLRLDFLTKYKMSEKLDQQEYKSLKFKPKPIKRVFDIIVASSVLLAVSPILLLVAILIRLESKGPVYYKSKRVGTGYHIFDFYKLRSMYMDADQRIKELAHLNQYTKVSDDLELDSCPRCEEKGSPCSSLLYIDGQEICEYLHRLRKKQESASAFMKIKDDPRITKVGKFIRKTSIDELPQLINVIKGDMSIVGNRPLPLYEAEMLTSDSWTARFNAPAGITGLWQISKRGKAEMSDEERKSLDNQYAMENSFTNDLKLILKTVPAMFQKENV